MTAHWKRIVAVALMLSVSTPFLTGCWDNKEINELFIVTGIAIDATDDPDQMDITVQVSEVTRGAAGSSGSISGETSSLLLKTSGSTIMGGLTELNQNSDEQLLLHHNQILLFGTALAEQGIKKCMDLFIRDKQARLEVSMVIVEGAAQEPLAIEMTHEPISGVFLAGMFEDLSSMSKEYRVRVLDFISRVLDETTAPVLPIIKVADENGSLNIQLAGMAVFKEDKMIGRLSNDETMGYISFFGNVQQCNIETANDSGRAVFLINNLNCKRKITLRPDGGVQVALSMDAVLSISELHGFSELSSGKLIPHLIQMAEEAIKQRVEESFKIAQDLNADIFGIGAAVYRKYPKEWKTMKDRWNEIFPDVDLSIKIKASIPGTGQIIQSLEMKENTK